MAQLQYSSVVNADNTHTVTRTVVEDQLSEGDVALLTVSVAFRQPKTRAALRACIDALRLDIRSATESDDLPTSGEVTL